MKRALILTLIVFAACKNEGRSQSVLSRTSDAPARAADAQFAVAQAPANMPPPPPPAEEPAANRMIVRNATLSIVVRDAIDVLRKATALVESTGGYVSNERQWKERDQMRGSATLRIPAAQLRATLTKLAALGVRVESEAVTGDDVTQEFSDSAAQLKNLQATEAELRALLATVRTRTQKASEIMEVFNELTNVRGQIERIQGRMKYLSQMTAMATINLELIPDAIAAPVVEPGWQPVATARAALRSLTNTLKSLADVAIWVVMYLVPVALMFIVAALALRAGWQWTRRRAIS
jgi:hypothetical protein